MHDVHIAPGYDAFCFYYDIIQHSSPGHILAGTRQNNGQLLWCTCTATLDVCKFTADGIVETFQAYPQQCDNCIALDHTPVVDIYWSVSGNLAPYGNNPQPGYSYCAEATAAGAGTVYNDIQCRGCDVSHCDQKQESFTILMARDRMLVYNRDALWTLWEDSVASGEEMGGIVITDTNGIGQFAQLTSQSPSGSQFSFSYLYVPGPGGVNTYYDDVNGDGNYTAGTDVQVGQGTGIESVVHTHPLTTDVDGPSDYDMQESEAAGEPYYVIDGNCDSTQPGNASDGGSGVYCYDPAIMDPYDPVAVAGPAATPILTWAEFDP
jgi:hypothetical protein